MSPWPGQRPAEGGFHVTMAGLDSKKKLGRRADPGKGAVHVTEPGRRPQKKNSADFSADFRISFHVTTS